MLLSFFFINFVAKKVLNMKCLERIVDKMLKLRLEAFGAVQIVGPKRCGKTTTALQQAKSVIKMQDPDVSHQ